MFLFIFMQECGPYSSRAYCIFALSTTDLKTNWITLLACITEANGGHIGGTHLM